MTIKIRVEDGVEYREEQPPEDWLLMATYHPHSCPWDAYGNKKCREWKSILRDVGARCETVVSHEKRVNPIGSGPGGQVRFGDGRMPGKYQLYVHPDDVKSAATALADHDLAIDEWLHGNGPMPQAYQS